MRKTIFVSLVLAAFVLATPQMAFAQSTGDKPTAPRIFLLLQTEINTNTNHPDFIWAPVYNPMRSDSEQFQMLTNVLKVKLGKALATIQNAR